MGKRIALLKRHARGARMGRKWAMQAVPAGRWPRPICDFAAARINGPRLR